MQALGPVLFVVSVLVLLVGLIKPAWVLPRVKKPNRIKAIGIAVLVFAVSIIIGISSEPSGGRNSAEQGAALPAAEVAATGGPNRIENDVQKAITDYGVTAIKVKWNAPVYDGDFGSVTMSINLGECYGGIVPHCLKHQVDIALSILKAIRKSHPEIMFAEVSCQIPLADKRDEYGHVTKGGTGELVYFSVDMSALDKFPTDFEWSIYPLYAADRFLTGVGLFQGVSVRSVWEQELHDEMKLGNFAHRPQPATEGAARDLLTNKAAKRATPTGPKK